MNFRSSALPRCSRSVSLSGVPVSATAGCRGIALSSIVNLQSSAISRPSLVTISGLISTSSASLRAYTAYNFSQSSVSAARSHGSVAGSAVCNASGSNPLRMSSGTRSSAPGCFAAISSMSMPPCAENSSRGPLLAGSLRTAAYISAAIGICCSTSTRSTRCSPIVMPRMACAAASASCGVAASLIPPALPRLPVATCALTTHGPMRCAAFAASPGVVARAPSGTAMPAARSNALPACSAKFICRISPSRRRTVPLRSACPLESS